MSPPTMPASPSPPAATAPPAATTPAPVESPTAAAVPCCPPLTAGALSPDDAEVLASRYRALSDPTRLRLVSLLLAADEVCVCDLTDAVGLAQPTVSHHLKALVTAGLVAREKRGVWAYYRALPAALAELGAVLSPAGESWPAGAAGAGPPAGRDIAEPPGRSSCG